MKRTISILSSSSSSSSSSCSSSSSHYYGRLWGSGYEIIKNRRIFSIRGVGATSFLQNLITSDLTTTTTTIPPPEEPIILQQQQQDDDDDDKNTIRSTNQQQQQQLRPVEFNSRLRSTCFLDPKGRIITDSLLWQLDDDDDNNKNNDNDNKRKNDNNDDGTSGEQHPRKQQQQQQQYHYILDVPDSDGITGNTLLQHLHRYKLRRTPVTIHDITNETKAIVVFGALHTSGKIPPSPVPNGFCVCGLDPRHPSLGLRILVQMPPTTQTTTPSSSKTDTSTDTTMIASKKDTTTASDQEKNRKNDSSSAASSSSSSSSIGSISNTTSFPSMPDNYELVRRLVGISEGYAELSGRTALECNQEFLNAVGFHKGCYLGQELTARSFYTGTIRKRIMPIIIQDVNTQIPEQWSIASKIQEDRAAQRYTKDELTKKLPSHRLPRLSVEGAGSIVVATTASIHNNDDDDNDNDENNKENSNNNDTTTTTLERNQQQHAKMKTIELLNSIEKVCIPGAKLININDNVTIGQIISYPMKGTNVVLAQMRLESVGIQINPKHYTNNNNNHWWSKMNKIRIVGGNTNHNNNNNHDDNNNTSKNNNNNNESITNTETTTTRTTPALSSSSLSPPTTTTTEFRYLPYIPLWWPRNINPITGKQIKDSDDENEWLDLEAKQEKNDV